MTEVERKFQQLREEVEDLWEFIRALRDDPLTQRGMQRRVREKLETRPE